MNPQPPIAAPDAIGLLEADHRAVEALFAELDRTTDKRARHALALRVCKELSVHDKLESKVFYPAAKRGAPKAEDEINEGIVEHEGIRLLVKELPTLRSSDEFFEPKLKVLIGYVKHHLREEEQSMFPRVREGRLDLVALAGQLMAAKEKYSLAYDERRPKRRSAGLFVGRSRSEPRAL